MAFPTFALTNPLQFFQSNGNLTASSTGSGTAVSGITTAAYKSSGKYYVEYTIDAIGSDVIVGIANPSFVPAVNEYPGRTGSTGYGITSSGLLIRNGASVHNFGAGYTTSDVISVLVDLDAGSIELWKNGTPIGTAYTSLAADSYAPAVQISNATVTANFGDGGFAFSPPGGYASWSEAAVEGAVTLANFIVVGAAQGGTVADAAVTLEQLSVDALHAINGAFVTLEPFTASAFHEMTVFVEGTLEQLTATSSVISGTVGSGAASLELMTADSIHSPPASQASGTLSPLTGTSEASSATVGAGAVTLEQLQVVAETPQVNDVVLEALDADAVAVAGTIAEGVVVLRNLSVEASATQEGVATGTAVLQPFVSSGLATQQAIATAAITMARLQVRAAAIGGTIGTAVVALEPLRLNAEGFPPRDATAAVTMQPAFVSGFSRESVLQLYKTWTTNLANEALTEYTNFKFNSYAYFNNKYYAAGPDGLFSLEGDTDNNVSIDWAFRTGMMDDKKINLKRLHEVLMAVRFNGPIRIRVWVDDETFYTYTITSFRDDILHQVRAKLGKGLRSRYFQIEFGSLGGSTCEIDSVELPFETVTRRIG